jgi:hypothetical protein
VSLLSRLQLSPFLKPIKPSPLIGRLFNPCLPLGVFFLALGFFLITGATTSADVVTIYFPAELSQNSGFTDKTGSSLLNGYLIRVGTFGSAPSTVASDWVGLTTTSSILAKLEEQFTPYDSFNFSENFLRAGTAYYPPDPEDPVPPAFGTDLFGKPIDIVFYDNAVASSASQILIVRMNAALQIDSTSISAGKFNTVGDPFNSGNRSTVFSLTADRVDLLWGFYNSQDDVFQTAVLEGGVNQITSPLTQTNAVGAVSTYQITANNGADRFFATTNTANADLTLTNLPTGFSIATNTGVITAATNAVAGTNTIRLIASNSLTASVATNILTWTLQASSLSFTTTTNLISAVAGVEISPFTFVSTGTSPTYTADGNLLGLTLSTNGILSGIPNSVGTNDVSITSSAGGQNGNTTFSLAVAAPTISVPAGALTGGQIVVTAGTATNISFSNTTTARFTNLTGLVSPNTTGVSFNGTNLIIATNALPLLKGTTNVTLTLTASRAVGGSTVSASTSVPLRIVAPAPTALVGPTEFEVDIGEAFSATILSDVGVYGKMAFSNLPNELRGFENGAVTGVADGTVNTNRSSEPWKYPVIVVADSTRVYEGGGIYTNTNVILRLRNTHPPVITSTNRKLGGVGRTFSYGIQTANSATSYEIIGNLPDGLSLSPSQQNIVGKPKTAGTYPLVLKAYNYSRPGSTNLLDRLPGTANLKLIISGGFPSAATPVASINNMTNGMVHTNTPFITTDGGMRLFAIGLPTGLGLDEYEGVLRGTNQSSGVFPVTLYMMNGNGWTIRQITLTVR